MWIPGRLRALAVLDKSWTVAERQLNQPIWWVGFGPLPIFSSAVLIPLNYTMNIERRRDSPARLLRQDYETVRVRRHVNGVV